MPLENLITMKKQATTGLTIPTNQLLGELKRRALTTLNEVVNYRPTLWQTVLSQFGIVGLMVLAFSAGAGLNEVAHSAPDTLSARVPAPPPTLDPVIVPTIDTLIRDLEILQPRKKPEVKKVSVRTPANQQEYIQRFAHVAIAEMHKFGIPASISLAQGLLESRHGKSDLAVLYNNHFGIKCFSKKCKRGHCVNYSDDSHKDYFRRYTSAWESWRAHSELLMKRYRSLKKHGKNYKAWAYGLKKLGYATSRTYAEDLIRLIEKYDLHKYDKK